MRWLDRFFHRTSEVVHEPDPQTVQMDAALTAAKAGDYDTALALWEPLARAGHARAQNNIGACFAEGLGVPSDRPLALNGNAIQLDANVALPKSEQSFSRWFDNSSTALNNPRPDGTFAWSVLGPNDYRVVKQRFHDVNEPTEPQWSFSLFKTTRVTQTVNMQVRLEAFNVFNVRVYGAPNTDPRSANFGIVDTASQVNFPRTLQIGVRVGF